MDDDTSALKWCLWRVKSEKRALSDCTERRTLENVKNLVSGPPSALIPSFVHVQCVSGKKLQRDNLIAPQIRVWNVIICLGDTHPQAKWVIWGGNEVKVREVQRLRPLLFTVITNHQMILTFNRTNMYLQPARNVQCFLIISVENAKM